MLKIVLGIIFFILLAVIGVFFHLGIKSLQKAQKDNDIDLNRRAVTYFKMQILFIVLTGIFFIICLVLLS
ncbi:hypothetical protein [Anaerocolumna chitinilytica]|uniref:Uncharacterized protein n=1 Tax=Anaerocolumna chitinilytica TaxID=1727145 RepID=A0A7I8DRH7_9FIRM|nr:hypothetical protein [Anaerocolumna chitinilytica]BCJ98886.1 hypothetical protein bsdcttw_19270 [Anaerocolumna chitinilytica]